jgi:hypothetical protein
MYKPLFTVAVALLATTSLSAVAQSSQPTTGPLAPNNVTRYYDDTLPQSLSDAARRVELETGGRIIEIRWLRGPERGYEAVVSEGQQVPLTYVRLNPLTDQLKVLRVEELADWMVPWEEREDADLVADATVPLSDAIQTAESYYDGVVTTAAITKPRVADTGMIAYQFDVWSNGTMTPGAVDATTGRPILQRDVELVYNPVTPEDRIEREIER